MGKKSILLSFLLLVRRIYDATVDIVLGYLLSSRPRRILPAVSENFMLISATQLAEKIRSRELTSEKVVSAFIDRIKDINGMLNAVVDDRFDAALAEARCVDKMLDDLSGNADKLSNLAKEKPFLGVPFTSKESTAAKGMAFTFGLLSRKGERAAEDSVIVTLIKRSGAILIAVTNVPEFNLWCETRNYVYGQTNNPYRLNRTPGGSSGGEASIISACGSPMGIGTDIGGSTRMPAYYCGIFGHKPTPGFISTKGMTFRTGEESHTIVAAGSLSRHAVDIEPFMRLLLADTPKDKLSLLSLDVPVDISTLKYCYILEPGDMRLSPVSNEVQDRIESAATHFSNITRHPHGVKKVNFKGFNYSLSIWRHMMTKEPSNFAFDVGNREIEVSLFKELPKKCLGLSHHTLPVIMRLIDLNILPVTDPDWAQKTVEKLVSDVEEELGDDGVLLFPSCPTVAPYHYASFFRPYNFAYWAIFNATMLPCTQVPMGISATTGLPLGLQIVASRNNDRLCWAVARELEHAFGGWHPPFPLKE